VVPKNQLGEDRDRKNQNQVSVGAENSEIIVKGEGK